MFFVLFYCDNTIEVGGLNLLRLYIQSLLLAD